MSELAEMFDEYLNGNSFTGELDEFEMYMFEMVESNYQMFIQDSAEFIPKVYMGIVNDYSFNAVAFKYKDRYFVGLNIGLIRIVKNFYNYLFSRNDVFTEFDASQEKNPDINIRLSDIDNYIDTIGDLFNNYDFEEIAPISIGRKEAAKNFASNALIYLFFHEYAHILHGHLDYSIQTNQNFKFLESTVKHKEGLILQCLEMHADSFAARTTISLINEPEVWLGSALTTGFSAVFMYQLLSTKIDNLEDLSDYSHPMPSIRQMIYLNVVHSYFNQFGIEAAEEVAGIVTNAVFKEYKMIFMNILGLEEESIAILLITNNEVLQHFRKIIDTWNMIRDDLSIYACAPVTDEFYWIES